MLSYRHAFHAGNATDVLKHSVLLFCMEYLLQKEKPLLCIDTHAGAGAYALNEGYAARNREWEDGFGKFINNTNDGQEQLQLQQQLLRQLPPLLRRYYEFCSTSENYSGSPLIMARLLRPVDRLVCYELHPADYAACKSALEAMEGRMEVRQTDGFSGLKSLLPPPSRRGLIFIDPSYEIKDDYNRVPEVLAMALGRFATGTYIVWYPLLREAPTAAQNFPQRLMEQYTGNRCRVELYTPCKDNSPRAMYGSGLAIFNPPWSLPAALSESLPVLGALMGTGEKDWKLDCLCP